MTDDRIALSDEVLALVEQVQANEHLHHTEEFDVYSVGIIYSSACTSLSDEDAEARMNVVPAGTTNGWRIAKAFRTGEPSGTPCDKKPATHRHILFEC